MNCSRRLEELVRLGPTAELADKPGGVFLRTRSGMSAEDVTLLEAAARAILRGDDGSLAAQLERAPDARDAAGRRCRAVTRHGGDRPPASRLLPTKRCCSPTGWAGSRRTAGSTS